MNGSGSRVLQSPWLPYAALFLSALPFGAMIAAKHPQSPGACSGIGFGCSLYGWEMAVFLLVVFGVPYAVGLAVVIGLLSRLPSRTPSLIVAWYGLGMAWVVVPVQVARM